MVPRHIQIALALEVVQWGKLRELFPPGVYQPLSGRPSPSLPHCRAQDGHVREQDRFLPIANISRIMKKALPGNAKVAKDAKETVQECVSEFISFITSELRRRVSRALIALFWRPSTGPGWRS